MSQASSLLASTPARALKERLAFLIDKINKKTQRII